MLNPAFNERTPMKGEVWGLLVVLGDGGRWIQCHWPYNSLDVIWRTVYLVNQRSLVVSGLAFDSPPPCRTTAFEKGYFLRPVTHVAFSANTAAAAIAVAAIVVCAEGSASAARMNVTHVSAALLTPLEICVLKKKKV